jgi:hypothetical protein
MTQSRLLLDRERCNSRQVTAREPFTIFAGPVTLPHRLTTNLRAEGRIVPGAPRLMKMGNTASLLRYDTGAYGGASIGDTARACDCALRFKSHPQCRGWTTEGAPIRRSPCDPSEVQTREGADGGSTPTSSPMWHGQHSSPMSQKHPVGSAALHFLLRAFEISRWGDSE